MINLKTDIFEFESILKKLGERQILELSQIPNIDLYVDQITTYIEENLDLYKRNEKDKILTKTMINNYSKDKLIPPAEKKKYTLEHMLKLIIICNLKPILSMNDIQKLLNSQDITTDIEDIYNFFTFIQKNEKIDFISDLKRKAEYINKFNVESSNKTEILFMVLALIIDASTKKQLAETIIDNYL